MSENPYHPHQSRGLGERASSPTEIKSVADEVTGELVPIEKAVRVVIEGKGRQPEQNPKRTIYLSEENAARLRELAGVDPDENNAIPENFLEKLIETISEGK